MTGKKQKFKLEAEVVNGKCPTCDQFEAVFHKTSIGRNPSKCKMNKSRRRSWKKYRGQGK